jgi:hypoxanthine phosphoribosyltransferase
MTTLWQRPLPPAWRRSPTPELTCFAHPAEQEVARILTFHGVRWVYEPTTFVLDRDAEGRPTLCFNPDFYLPDHNRYLELTTMRQAHATRKNRKLRLLRERYPTIDAHILYRRDFDRLATRYRPGLARGTFALGDVLIDADQIAEHVRRIAAERIGREVPDAVVSLGRGAAWFAAELVDELQAQGVYPGAGELTLAGSELTSRATRLRIRQGPRVAIDRRRVLLVADVVSTGLTADFAIRWLQGRGAGPIEVVTLIDRPAARIVRIPIRGKALEIDDTMVAGHGIAVSGYDSPVADIVEVRRTGA